MKQKRDTKKEQVLRCIGYHIQHWGEVLPDSMVADMTDCTTQYVGRVKQSIGIEKQVMGDITTRTQYRINDVCDVLKLGVLTQDTEIRRLVRGAMVDVGTYKTKEQNVDVFDYNMGNRGYRYLGTDSWIKRGDLPLLLHFLMCAFIRDTKEGGVVWDIQKGRVSFMDIAVWQDKERARWRGLVKETTNARKRMGLD